MKPLIFAILAMFSMSVPVLAQAQAQAQLPSGQQSSATAKPDLDPQGNLAGPHSNQTSPGDADNPAPHIYKRGEHISRSYGAFDVVSDWNRFHLTRPPEGSHWVKYGANYLLVDEMSGRIDDIVKAS